MHNITSFIQDDIIKQINAIGFTYEETLDIHLHAVTFVSSHVIFANPDLVTLYELSEEYFHARLSHKRQHKEYDVRNPDEREAHNLALTYLINRWVYYDGSNNWLTFTAVTGVPYEFEQKIIEEFQINYGLPTTHMSFI